MALVEPEKVVTKGEAPDFTENWGTDIGATETVTESIAEVTPLATTQNVQSTDWNAQMAADDQWTTPVADDWGAQTTDWTT